VLAEGLGGADRGERGRRIRPRVPAVDLRSERSLSAALDGAQGGMTTLDDVRDDWNRAAQADAMGHILTTGQAWDAETFFAHGRAEVEPVIERLDDLGLRGKRRKLALDFGCGVGRLSQALADHYDRVVGLDIAPSMVEQAEQLNQFPDRVTYIAGEQLPAGRFDLIYTNIVLQHMPQPIAHDYVRAFVAHLAPDGLAVFNIPEGPDVPHHEPCLSMWGSPRDEIERVVEAAGGVICDVDVVPAPGSQWIPWRYTVRRAPRRRAA
jgi:2-polyprenyl-3-methyl-5-hydroxy-6-metoxy-1,4-benzoquinol methylase